MLPSVGFVAVHKAIPAIQADSGRFLAQVDYVLKTNPCSSCESRIQLSSQSETTASAVPHWLS